jgi:uncharacterized membrane protein YkoI
MKAVRTSLILALALAGMLLLHQGALAAPSRVAARQVSAQRKVSMDQAVRLAQRQFRARVVRAETEMQGDRTIYVLRMLDGTGRVFAVRVDAESGAIL